MPHGFKQIRQYYFSKAGHDSNAGTDPNAPKKTPLQQGAGIHLIGAGDYLITGVMGSTPGIQTDWYGDGVATLRANASLDVGIPSASFVNLRLINLIITSVVNGDRAVNSCFCKGCSFAGGNINQNRGRYCSGSVFVNCNFGAASLGAVSVSSSCFINCTSTISNTTLSQCTNSYFDFTSVLTWVRLDGVGFSYNNIQGRIVLGGKSYAIQDQLVGTPQDNGYAVGVNWLSEAQLTADGYAGTIAGWNAKVATCINRAPGFIDAPNENFSLRSDSEMLGKGSDGLSPIGGRPVEYEIKNTDHGSNNIFVEASPEINTTDPNGYVLSSGSEGYVDYVFPTGGKKLGRVLPNLPLNFNTDFAGGSVQNNDVPDAWPLTATYALKTTTTGAPGVTNQLIVPEGLIEVNDWIRVNGQYRTVLSKVNAAPNDTLTLSSALLTTIGSGVTVSYGTEDELADLNPNRLSYALRTRSAISPPSFPLTDTDWDNEIDPAYGKVGTFFQQDPTIRPGLVIAQDAVYGVGDSRASLFYPVIELAPQWVDVRVYLRDNYNSSGL